ncbi:MAG: deoxyribonuclease IV [Bacillota bacterium]
MRFGAHLSIGRGWLALARTARAEGMEAVQAFSRSPRGRQAKAIDPADAAAMRRELETGGIRPLVIHVPYFVNLATADPEARRYTVETIALDLIRAAQLGASQVITHLGSAPGDRAEALDRVATTLTMVLEASARTDAASRRVGLLLENSGGGGGDVGSRLEDLAAVLKTVGRGPSRRLGLCLDTCHAFVAGYDLSSPAGLGGFMDEADRLIGLDRVKAFHLNDAQGELGSHLDRHAPIGQGRLGLGTFAALNGRSEFKDTPGLLETPEEGRAADLAALKALRS